MRVLDVFKGMYASGVSTVGIDSRGDLISRRNISEEIPACPANRLHPLLPGTTWAWRILPTRPQVEARRSDQSVDPVHFEWDLDWYYVQQLKGSKHAIGSHVRRPGDPLPRITRYPPSAGSPLR